MEKFLVGLLICERKTGLWQIRGMKMELFLLLKTASRGY